MWPFRRTRETRHDSWPIVRTKPIRRTYGRSVSTFINNWQCHLTTVDAYADGAVDCWGFVDLALFEGKVRSNWVVPAPKPDQTISVFNFGCTGVLDGFWSQSSRSIVEEVVAIVRTLNPSMTDLLDMDGSDTEVLGKIRSAKLGLSDKKCYRRASATSEDILGDSVPVLRIIDDAFELVRLAVFSDGMCQLACDHELVPLDSVRALYDTGQICNIAPGGSRVVLPGLGSFRTKGEFGFLSVQDRIGEIYDKHGVLNGKPSVVAACARLFEAYEQDPSPTTKEALRVAYEAVPTHLRCYCGDMDTRDTAIRAALYGEDREP